jgi:hypothetical protein
MPLGEIIGEVLYRGLFEIIFCTIAYYTGALVLGVLTLGQLKLAPLDTIEQTNKKKNRWNDWSIWLYRPMQARVWKADIVCLVGLIFWISVGTGLFFAFRTDKDKSELTDAANRYPFGTSVMSPANPASRAGDTPEASSDS